MSVLRALGLACLMLTSTGCERAMHDMYEQPRYDANAPSALFADGSSARTPPAGSLPIAAGANADSSGGRRGHLQPLAAAGRALPLDDAGNPLATSADTRASAPPLADPLPITPARLQRGRERFDIYCAPCHGRGGDGAGMIAQRGFPAPPSYHTPRLRNAADAHFYRVISNGYGIMYPYADRIAPDDRWAIVAYIRALQLSAHARRDELQPQDLQALAAAAAQTRTRVQR